MLVRPQFVMTMLEFSASGRSRLRAYQHICAEV